MIGVHFLGEGLTKLEERKPFSAAFFSNAKGPLAPFYQGLVWDADGEYRLDVEATLAAWNAYVDQIAIHYGFDEKQLKQADQAVKRYEGRLKQFVSTNAEAIDEYYRWLDRRAHNAQQPERQLASLQKHDARIAAETRKLYAQLVPPIDALWKDLENDLNAIATDEQWQRHGRLPIGKPGRQGLTLDTELLDAFMPWFNTVIGACLILGLFTRPAALLGAAFLASVCLSQWPTAPGAAPIYYQAVEMVALVVLAATGAGRILGMDFLFGGLKAMCCTPKRSGAI